MAKSMIVLVGDQEVLKQALGIAQASFALMAFNTRQTASECEDDSPRQDHLVHESEEYERKRKECAELLVNLY